MQASKTEKGIRLLLESIGENTNRTGLLETPARTARMYEEIFGGYNADVREILSKRFPVNENPDENPGDSQSANSDIACDAGIVLEKNITFYSMCEHHMLPFYGHAHIAYIPRNEVVGISKLARLTEAFARRLQIQASAARHDGCYRSGAHVHDYARNQKARKQNGYRASKRAFH